MKSVGTTRVSACVLIQLGREGVLKGNGIKREKKAKDKLSPFPFSFPFFSVFPCNMGSVLFISLFAQRLCISRLCHILHLHIVVTRDKKNIILMCTIVYLLFPLVPANLSTRSSPAI